ncbi:MAG: NAD-dependent epimerase/dehydratase family protein [Candidatus Marinimicrobia bacterium]|jgi:UDP-glucose 4-epimerase|nr:NAD-dependent epimerase/dehydratase family protein [Candidatus Neomarinimicrobiota bacterium]
MAILITGSSGYIGTELCRRYELDETVEDIVGLDVVPPKEDFSKLVFYQRNCNSDLIDIFQNHQIQTVIHLVFALNPTHDSKKMFEINVGSLENVMSHVDQFGVRRLVVTSSATAYGAHSDNPPRLTEDNAIRGNEGFQYSRDKATVESRLADFQNSHSDVDVIIARLAIVCGPHINNFVSRYVSKPLVPLVKDADVEMQYIHEEDVADALYVMAAEAPAGAYNLGPPETISDENAVAEMGGRVLRLGPRLIRWLTALAWSLRLKFLTEAPSSMIDFIEFPWVVDGSRIERETSFRYRYSSSDAIRAFAQKRQEA